MPFSVQRIQNGSTYALADAIEYHINRALEDNKKCISVSIVEEKSQYTEYVAILVFEVVAGLNL